ncbi:MAG: hypothetical protein WCH82_14580 [Mycobacteriaceae bacterium]
MEHEAGWYRDESGQLRYWNGRSWAGQSTLWPFRPPARRFVPTLRWGTALIAAGWIAAILGLGMLLTDVSAGGVDCGYVFAPHAAVQDAHAECDAALEARTRTASRTAVVALVCLAAGSRSGDSVIRPWRPRGISVLA